MTIEEIRNLIGEVMDNSHQLFQDPQYTDFECTELLYPYIYAKAYRISGIKIYLRR